MFNLASKVFVAIATLAVVAGIVYGLATGDRSGYVLMLAAALGLAVLALANVVYDAPEPFRALADDTASGSLPVDTSDVAAASAWPLAAAVSAGLVAVGAATSGTVLVLGVIAVALSGLAWLSQAWQEHPAWTEAMTVRLNERIVLPFVLPATVVVLIAVAVVSFSRLLLAVSKTAAWVIALLVALAVLLSLAFIASRERVGAAALKMLAALSAVLLLAAGVAGAVAGEREFHPHGEAGHFSIEANNNDFNVGRLQVPATTTITVEVENHDAVAHTFSVYFRDGGDEIFRGDEVAGGETHEYEVETPGEGRYWFQCDIHPDQMFGIFEVLAAEGAGPSPPGSSGTEETH